MNFLIGFNKYREIYARITPLFLLDQSQRINEASMLRQVKLGSNGPLVSRIGFGCMGMSGNYEADRNDAISIETIKNAYRAGVNFFDTADIYGEGHSESLLGEALAEYLETDRDNIVIATKCGFVSTHDGGFYIDVSKAHIAEACENSLRRLHVDYIDLYYLHRPPSGGISDLAPIS